jgi:hypothetical protein
MLTDDKDLSPSEKNEPRGRTFEEASRELEANRDKLRGLVRGTRRLPIRSNGAPTRPNHVWGSDWNTRDDAIPRCNRCHHLGLDPLITVGPGIIEKRLRDGRYRDHASASYSHRHVWSIHPEAVRQARLANQSRRSPCSVAEEFPSPLTCERRLGVPG